MSRLILIPQMPVTMRYQEWWFEEFPKQFRQYFSEVCVMAPPLEGPVTADKEGFSSYYWSLQYELSQIDEYLNLELKDNDVLLLNDLSYPGLFSNVLFHKCPKRCFAICHATSLNRFDLFQPVRFAKYPVEKGQAKLFQKIFVGSHYHAKKLGWKNTKVLHLPMYPTRMIPKVTSEKRVHLLASVSRVCPQKVSKGLESRVEKALNVPIIRERFTTWDSYFQFLQTAKYLLITAKEETYGYQVIDALMNGCIPIAPRACSYPELLPDSNLYSSFEELIGALLMERAQLVEVEENNFFKEVAGIMQGGSNE